VHLLLGIFHSYLFAKSIFLKYVVDSLLLLVDRYACAIFVRGSWFFIVVVFFFCVFLFSIHRLLRTTKRRRRVKKMTGMTKNQPSQWWWLDSHTTSNRSPWLQSTLSGMHCLINLLLFFLLPSEKLHK